MFLYGFKHTFKKTTLNILSGGLLYLKMKKSIKNKIKLYKQIN